jgi:hypothetical protein
MRLSLALLALTATTPALADEVWSTPIGDIVYERDMGTVAIWKQNANDTTYTYYILGLGGNTAERYFHTGYWLAPGAGNCDVAITGPDKQTSTTWGHVSVAFDFGGFPSGFTMQTSACGEPMDGFLRAEPLTGN